MQDSIFDPSMVFTYLKHSFMNTFNWKSRSGRGEFLTFQLLSFLLGVAFVLLIPEDLTQAIMLNSTANMNETLSFSLIILSAIAMIILGIAGLGVTVRRLHDMNLSGWWILLIIGLQQASSAGLIHLFDLTITGPGLHSILLSLAVQVPIWIFLLQQANHDNNRYGEEENYRSSEEIRF